MATSRLSDSRFARYTTENLPLPASARACCHQSRKQMRDADIISVGPRIAGRGYSIRIPNEGRKHSIARLRNSPTLTYWLHNIVFIQLPGAHWYSNLPIHADCSRGTLIVIMSCVFTMNIGAVRNACVLISRITSFRHVNS